GTPHNVVKLWNVAKGNTLAELVDRVSAHFVAGGRYLVTQTTRPENQHLYDLEANEDCSLFTNDPKQYPYIVKSVNSSSLFCCFYDGRIVKRELPSGNIVAEQKAMMEKGRGFSNWALSADGRFLAGSAITQPPVRRGGHFREDWEEVSPPEIHIW